MVTTPVARGLEEKMASLGYERQAFDVTRRQAHEGLFGLELQIDLIADPPLQHVDLLRIIVGHTNARIRRGCACTTAGAAHGDTQAYHLDDAGNLHGDAPHPADHCAASCSAWKSTIRNPSGFQGALPGVLRGAAHIHSVSRRSND